MKLLSFSYSKLASSLDVPALLFSNTILRELFVYDETMTPWCYGGVEASPRERRCRSGCRLAALGVRSPRDERADTRHIARYLPPGGRAPFPPRDASTNLNSLSAAPNLFTTKKKLHYYITAGRDSLPHGQYSSPLCT